MPSDEEQDQGTGPRLCGGLLSVRPSGLPNGLSSPAHPPVDLRADKQTGRQVMGDKTGIEWTRGEDGTPGATWNPTTGCDRTSPGCDNCYAMTLAPRLQAMEIGRETRNPKYSKDGNPATSGVGFGVSEHPFALDQPLRWTRPRKIFVNSMSDLFHAEISDEFIARVWQVMGAAPQHTYQVLTKRHGRMKSWTTRWYAGEIAEPYEVRPVPGYPGYSVSTTGQVFGKHSDTAGGLMPETDEQGHLQVTMHRKGSPRSGSRELVHRLVLSAFARPARAGEQARHLNGNPSDNRLSNLRWGTQNSNWQDRDAHGNRQSHHKFTDDQVAAVRAKSAHGDTAPNIARDYPISDTQVRNIVAGQHWPGGDPVVYAPGERAVLDCVWLGVSVETQQWADIRIPALLDTPAVVRWVSAEPLLGPVDLTRLCPARVGGPNRTDALRPVLDVDTGAVLIPGLDWIVVGGESGAKARPMHPQWARDLRDKSDAAGVPYLFKQWGEWTPGSAPSGSGLRECTVAADDGTVFEPPRTLWESASYGDRDRVNRKGWTVMHRTGKHAAGRVLDGTPLDGYPVGCDTVGHKEQVLPAG